MKKGDKRKNIKFPYFFASRKKGISTVITTLILVLLALVIIGIIWVVITRIVSEGSEEVTLDKFTVSLKIESASINQNTRTFDVKVKRNPGAGEVTGLSFVVSDGANSETIRLEDAQINELEEKTFSLTLSGLVKKISVAPLFASGSGGNIADELEFTDKEVIKNLGAISWWRLDGNANDEIGDNDGTCTTCPTSTSGKYGNAYEFDGVDDYIEIPDDASLNIANKLTVAVWVNPKVNTSTYGRIIGKGWAGDGAWILMTVEKWDFGGKNATGGGSQYQVYSNNPYSAYLGKWTHLVGVYDGSELKMYVNGVAQSTPVLFPGPLGNAETLNIGSSSAGFHGTIDEIIIFNKALTPEEITALYAFEFE